MEREGDDAGMSRAKKKKKTFGRAENAAINVWKLKSTQLAKKNLHSEQAFTPHALRG